MTDRSWDDLAKDNDGEYGESWVPNKDSTQPRTLLFTVLQYSAGPATRFEDKPWICNVQDHAGKAWSIWLLSDRLKDEFAEQRPMPGERAALRYVGLVEKKSAPGEYYHQYVLTVDRERDLPEFLTRPQLEDGDQPERRRDIERTGESDIPVDKDAFTYGQPPVDADVIEDDQDDEDDGDESVPF